MKANKKRIKKITRRANDALALLCNVVLENGFSQVRGFSGPLPTKVVAGYVAVKLHKALYQ